MKIFLTGFPGSGKTYLGSRLGALMKYSFIDTDKLLEEREKKSVTDIFGQEGEAAFRIKEAAALRSLERTKNAVIATGGGLPCFHENMFWMNEHGKTIYLKASAAFLFHRLVKEKKGRPLISSLSDIDLMIYITETLVARQDFYAMSKLLVNAETCTPAKLLSAIKKI